MPARASDPPPAARRAPVEKLVGGTWQAQGPGPNTFGQVENVFPENEVVGAIHTVLAHPTNASILYVGAANGGVWKTTNAFATRPHWVRLTDAESSLSIGALAFDTLDATRQTLVAGLGRFSSYAFIGGSRDGLLRTTDGGTTWTPIDGGGTITGLNVSGLAVRGQTIVLSAHDPGSFSPQTGIWRSTDGGASFALVSGAPGTGLPAGRTHDLVVDPTLGSRLFTTVADEGLYRSTDTGATWSKVSDSALDAALVGEPINVELAVGNHGNVFVAIAPTIQLQHVFRSANLGASWIEMDLPGTIENGSFEGIHPGGQARWHLSIAADPTDPDIVYVGGDRQDSPFPNSIGAFDFTGRLFRGDASQPLGSQWVHLTHSSSMGPAGGGTASSSAPHADSREMTFDAAGNLIETDDGGIYRRTQPRSAAGDWISINGDLQTTEFHSAAYDPLSNVVIGGAQDNGTPVQELPDLPRWTALLHADGGDVATAVLSADTSLRYSSFQFLGAFLRSFWDEDNVFFAGDFPALTPIGAGTPPISGQFTTPIAINQLDPQRLVIGAANGVFESLDQGDTVRRVGQLTVNSLGLDPIAYGSASNPDVLYVGTGGEVHVRTAAYPAEPVFSAAFAGAVVAIDVDPDDAATAYVATSNGVFRTTNAGGTWNAVTGDLFTVARTPLRSLALLPGITEDGLAVGTDDGVFVAFASTGFADWDRLGSGLPAVPVFDLGYDVGDNVLLAGTLGRGAWKLASVLEQDAEPPVAAFTSACTGLGCAFDASASSDNVGIVSYEWTFGDGGTGSGVTPQHTYSASGVYTVTLTVADAAGNTDTESASVIADGAPPLASFTVVCNGLVCDFDGTASTDDVGIASWTWDFGDGSPSGSGATTQHAYAAPGIYTATLTVTDLVGKSDSASQEVDLDTPPVACFTVSCSNLTCAFDATCSSDDVGIVSFAWDFGDGATAGGALVTHSFFQDGVYPVTLTVTDGVGQSDVETTPLELFDEEAFLLLHVLCP